MGLFDKMKDAQAQAKRAMANLGTMQGVPAGVSTAAPANMDEMLRHRDLTQKLKASGVEAPAVITAIRRGEADPLSGSIKTEIDLNIKPADGDPYPATVKQSILPAWLDTLSAGEAVTVKYDPDNRMSALIYGGV